MKHKLTRFEVNKEIRHIMARHRVDSSLLQYQCHGYEIELSGIMWHTDDTDFDANQIDAMIKDFQKTLPEYEVKGHTENWSFSAHSINSVYNVFSDHEDEMPAELEGDKL
ncbi:MAG: hypothetical protein K2P81_16530 [Bacteriovoracaceae bacterium]|nr:hypothetical protein [Bacteriovoracaceae bacterium]